MEEFFHAGGLPVVMNRISHLLKRDAPSVTGNTIGEVIADAVCYDDEVIRPLDKALMPQGGIKVLKGNLAPRGAILKPAAASPRLMQHRGKALVFKDAEDFRVRIDDPDLEVDANSVLVLKQAGPVSYRGRPEVGSMALPKKLLAQGVTDMVRISDTRMSGTAFGTVVLHVAPESALGGPLALVMDGDIVALDVAARSLTLEISEAEFERRRAAWVAPPPHHLRGYGKLYIERVLQADQGADFDFLTGSSGTPKSKVSF